jgi:hypothetical protein
MSPDITEQIKRSLKEQDKSVKCVVGPDGSLSTENSKKDKAGVHLPKDLTFYSA